MQIKAKRNHPKPMPAEEFRLSLQAIGLTKAEFAKAAGFKGYRGKSYVYEMASGGRRVSKHAAKVLKEMLKEKAPPFRGGEVEGK